MLTFCRFFPQVDPNEIYLRLEQVADDTPTNAKVMSVPDTWYSYPFFISMSCWYPRAWETLVESQEWNLKDFFLQQPLFYLHRVADPHHNNADPVLDPSFHFNTDPDQTFSTSMQIRIRVLLLINIMRVCDYGSKDPPFYYSTPSLWASTALHGSILTFQSSWNLNQVFHDQCENFSWKKLKNVYH